MKLVLYFLLGVSVTWLIIKPIWCKKMVWGNTPKWIIKEIEEELKNEIK